MNTFLALMKREFWEHKRILIWPPAIVAIIAIGLTISSLIISASAQSDVFFGFQQVDPEFSAFTDEQRAMITAASVVLTSNLFLGICGLTALYYLAGSLYNDRKDRSILFWKSMPVTEIQTVFSKLLTGMLLFPVFAIAFTIVSIILCHGVLLIFSLFLEGHIVDVLTSELGFSFSGFMKGIGNVGITALHTIIYLIPLFCYLLFVSSISKRSPILFALIPYIALLIISPILLRYVSPDNWLIAFFNNYLEMAPNPFSELDLQSSTQSGEPVSNHIWSAKIGALLSTMEFWIMMAISAGLLWATVLLRKSSGDLS